MDQCLMGSKFNSGQTILYLLKMVNPKKNTLVPWLLEVYHWSFHHWIFYPHKHAWWNPEACQHCWN